MCGIAGSSNPETAFKLYQSNLNRGYYSSGFMFIDDHNAFWVGKNLGVFNNVLTGASNVEYLFSVPFEYEPQPAFHLYHSRGPTTETKEFVPDNNHPFMYKGWVVAHNGIISNFDILAKKYFPEENFTGKTDSCIIPRLLSIKPIKEALEELKGTFAIWAWNRDIDGIYLCRSGVTLFASMDNGDFCSTEFKNSEPLEEGYIYKIQNFKSITKISSFHSNSPYFIL